MLDPLVLRRLRVAIGVTFGHETSVFRVPMSVLRRHFGLSHLYFHFIMFGMPRKRVA